VGANTTNTWSITAANAGTINGSFTFSNMQYLTGGSGNDTFAIGSGAGVRGVIKGSGGSNTLDYSGYGKAIGVNLASGSAPGMLSFSGIQTVVGSTASNNTLFGANTSNTWSITAANAGTINGTLTFSNFQYLKGGSADDSFAFAAGGNVSGSINGEGGDNTLDYSALSAGVTVNLTTGTASHVGSSGTRVFNIDGVLGGAGKNTLTGGAFPCFLVGGAGNDTLNGGVGAAVLIGDAGTDTLNGGSGQDILIGDTTTYDNSAGIAALDAILSEWGSSDSYSQKIADLSGMNGTGNRNGSNFLTTSAVTSDTAANILNGGPGTDWFFQSAADTVTNPGSGQVVSI
jgi:hypothetical protein